MRCPRVGVDAAFAPQLLDVSSVDHAEVEAELLQHLDTPFFLQRSGTDDQDGTGAVPEQHLLDDQSGLDGLAQPDIVRDEEVDAGHVDGAYQRDRKSTRLNSSHVRISYAVFCLKKKNNAARR